MVDGVLAPKGVVNKLPAVGVLVLAIVWTVPNKEPGVTGGEPTITLLVVRVAPPNRPLVGTGCPNALVVGVVLRAGCPMIPPPEVTVAVLTVPPNKVLLVLASPLDAIPDRLAILLAKEEAISSINGSVKAEVGWLCLGRWQQPVGLLMGINSGNSIL